MIRRAACLVAMTGALVTFFAVSVSASAATRYAEPTGNGPEPCDLADPCSLQTAVEGTVTDGDEVILLPGTYVETNELDAVNAIDMHGQSGSARPTIMSSAGVALFSNDPGTVIHHLDIESSGVFEGLFLQAGTVDEVIVHQTASGGFSTVACSFPGAVGATIRDTVCWNSGDGGSGVGLNQSNGTAAIKLRNVTAVSTASTNSYGLSLGASNSANVSIDGRAVISQGLTADIRASEDATSNSTINLDTSNYFTVSLVGPSPTVTPAGSGTNQTAEPLFVDAATGDFHQAPGSPTIDAGGLDGFSGSIDIDGDPRTLGAAPDIGADEFAPSQPPTVTTPPASAPTGQRAAALAKCKKKHNKALKQKAANHTLTAQAKKQINKKFKKCKKKANLLPV